MKNEKYKQTLTTTIKFFIFVWLILIENIVWENEVYIITFLVKFCLVLHDI